MIEASRKRPAVLEEFARGASHQGKRTSLVAFFEPDGGRRTPNFCVTFQPRFVLDGVAAGSPHGESARKTIRKRLRAYDSFPPAPVPGGYGAPGNREWAQYFLGDDNRVVPESERCPFDVNSNGKEEV